MDDYDNAFSAVKLVPGKSDKELAEELKQEFISSSKPLSDVMTKATKLGFQINFQMAPNTFGEVVIQTLTIAKLF